MLLLNGLVQNVFSKPASTDPKTGEQRPASDHVQVLCENVLESGEKRLDMVTLKVPSAATYKALLGRQVCVPVGAFAKAGEMFFYALKNEPNPVPVKAAA